MYTIYGYLLLGISCILGILGKISLYNNPFKLPATWDRYESIIFNSLNLCSTTTNIARRVVRTPPLTLCPATKLFWLATVEATKVPDLVAHSSTAT